MSLFRWKFLLSFPPTRPVRYIYTTLPKYGILSDAQDANTLKQIEQQKITFQNIVRTMLATKKYSINDFYRECKTLLETARASQGITGSIKNFVSGQPEELKEMEDGIAFFELLTVQERMATSRKEFNFQKKNEICARSQGKVTNEKFNSFMAKYDHFAMMHRFLHRRAAKYLPPPETSEDLSILMRDDPGCMSEARKNAGVKNGMGRK